MNRKEENLKAMIRSWGTVAVAFSGGVDSTYLVKVAHDELGDRAVAITACLSSFPAWEREDAVCFCRKEGIRHILLTVDEFAIDGFCDNPKNRCYLCKTALFRAMWDAVRPFHIAHIAEGSNTDDDQDFRPGHRAIGEQHIDSPLRAAGLSKQEIRSLSHQMGLPTWNKPSYACLASRFVYGERITPKKLSMVEAAEQFLHEHGFLGVRVRLHGDMARIETDKNDFARLLAIAEETDTYLKSLGFSYVSLDLKGYRTGSMNPDFS